MSFEDLKVTSARVVRCQSVEQLASSTSLNVDGRPCHDGVDAPVARGSSGSSGETGVSNADCRVKDWSGS